MNPDTDKLWVFFTNLRTGWHIQQPDHMTPDQISKANERSARLYGPHFIYTENPQKDSDDYTEPKSYY